MRRLYCQIANFLTCSFFQSQGGSSFFSDRFGRSLAILSWWAFIIALVSGIVLSFNYRPWGNVYLALSKLTYQFPYGIFFRKLHYLSGQCFLLFALAHMSEHFLRRTFLHMKPIEWLRLVSAFFLSFPLVFTGFILKGDKEGIFAGEVMVNLAREIPIVGAGLAMLLLKPGEDFFLRPYLHHTVTLPLLVIFLLGGHRRRLFLEKGLGLLLLVILGVLTFFYQLPPDIPPRAEIAGITGPWFFHGIQLLLHYGSPLMVGILWPMTPILLMLALAFPLVSSFRQFWILTALLWVIHLIVLCVAWFLLPILAGVSG